MAIQGVNSTFMANLEIYFYCIAGNIQGVQFLWFSWMKIKPAKKLDFTVHYGHELSHPRKLNLEIVKIDHLWKLNPVKISHYTVVTSRISLSIYVTCPNPLHVLNYVDGYYKSQNNENISCITMLN